MKIMNMRWGCDSLPVSDTIIAEVMAHDENGNIVFVLVSRLMEFEYTMVSAWPMFDISMNLINSEINKDGEWKKLTDNAIAHYDYEIAELPEELYSNPYANVIRLARLATYEACLCEDIDSTSINDMFDDYLDKDINSFEPELIEKLKALEEDGEWDEEQEEEM